MGTGKKECQPFRDANSISSQPSPRLPGGSPDSSSVNTLTAQNQPGRSDALTLPAVNWTLTSSNRLCSALYHYFVSRKMY